MLQAQRFGFEASEESCFLPLQRCRRGPEKMRELSLVGNEDE